MGRLEKLSSGAGNGHGSGEIIYAVPEVVGLVYKLSSIYDVEFRKSFQSD